MSHRKSKEKERYWSPIRLPGDRDRKDSRRHYRSLEGDRDHKVKRKIKRREEEEEEEQTRVLEDTEPSSHRSRKHSSSTSLKRRHRDAEVRDDDKRGAGSSKRRRRKRSRSEYLDERKLVDGDTMSHRRSKEKEHNWSTKRLPGDGDRKVSRRHYRRSESGREHKGSTSLKRRHRDAEVSDDDERGAGSSKRRRRERSRSEDLDESLELVIIGKSRNAGQFCVLGYDGNHIYRPVNFSTGSLFWQVDRFEVGKMYRFFLNGDDRNFKKLSSPPHRFNDINVTDHAESIHDREKAKSLIKKLINNAKTHMDFQDVMERKFVVEDTECPSACLYRCSARDVELYRSRIGKQRVSVAGFDFPFAGVYSDIRKTFDDYDRNAVVVLSLTRPFGGFSDRVFNPKRCYILVVGVHSY